MWLYVCLAADGAQAVNDNYRDWTTKLWAIRGNLRSSSLHCSLFRHIVSCLLSDVWNYKCQETNWAGWDRAGQAGTVNTTTDGVMVCYHPLLVYLLLCLGKPVPANQGWPTSLLSNSLVSLHLSWQKAKSIPLSDQSSVWMFDVDLMFNVLYDLFSLYFATQTSKDVCCGANKS